VDILFHFFAADIGKKCATNLDGKLVRNIDGGDYMV